MRETKIWFGIFILLIVSFLVFSPIAIRPYVEGREITIKGVTIFKGPDKPVTDTTNFTIYQNPTHNSCYVSIPQPSIILRLDDVRAFSVPAESVIEEFRKNNVSLTIGVIPRELETDPNLIAYLKSIKNDSRIEIAQHGVYHNESDINLTEADLLYGLSKIETLLKVKPVTYTQPFDDEPSAATKKILAEYYKGTSGTWGVLKEGEIAELGHTISNYNIIQDPQKNILNIVSACKDNIERQNYCVVLLHPQEFATDINNPVNVSDEKIAELDKLIVQLKQLNATFVTFKDVVDCTELPLNNSSLNSEYLNASSNNSENNSQNISANTSSNNSVNSVNNSELNSSKG